MGSPDILTRINTFLALLPPIHLYNEPEEKDKDEFSFLLEKLLHKKDQSPDKIEALSTGKQIWQIMEKKNPALGSGKGRTITALETEGIKEGEDENEKREYFSSLIISCFVEPGQRSNYPLEGFEDSGERLFFYSSQYSNQARGEGTSSLKILKEAIGSLNKKKPEQGILEGLKDPDPGSESGTRLAASGPIEDDLFLSGASFKKEKDQVFGQDTLNDRLETGEDGHKEVSVFPSFDPKNSNSSLEEKAGQDAGYLWKDDKSSLFEEEESSLDDSKEGPDETFIFNEGSQGTDTESFINFGSSGQATSTPKFISEETKGEISKIIQRIKLLKEAEETEVRMELDLERLGRLKVKITKEDGGLQTEFLAESSEAKELIESNISALRDALLSLGFGQVKIKTTVDHQGNDDFFRQKRGRSSLAGSSKGGKEEVENDDLLDRPSISLRGESLNMVA